MQRRTDGNLYVPTGKSLVVEASGTLDVSAGTLTMGAQTGTTLTASTALIAKKLELGPAATEAAYGAAMAIDVTYSLHVIAGVSGTSATVAFTPSAAGTAGDVLMIVTAADGSGTVTATFSSTFHSSGTQATTLSHFSTITFVSDGTRWLEVARTTNLA